MERELDQVTEQQRTQQQAFQTVQDQNNEKLALLQDEIRLTQESVEKIKEDSYKTHVLYARPYIHSRRCIAMLSIRKCLAPLSSIVTTLLLTNWHTVYTF